MGEELGREGGYLAGREERNSIKDKRVPPRENEKKGEKGKKERTFPSF